MIGRSFLGFALLSLPLGLWGLSRLSDKVIARMGFILIAVSLFGLALCPANPLWPVKSVAQRLEHAHASEGIVGAVRKYGSYTERYYCGRSLVARIPADVQRLGAIMGREPLLQLWHPYSFRRSVVLFNLRTTVRQVENSGLDWIVIGGDACEFMPTLIDGLLGSSRFHLVAEEQYVSKLQRGPEPWRLLKRVE